MRASPRMRRFVLLCLLLFPLSVLAAGCSSEGTVSGTVYYKGKPLKEGMILFFPESKGGDFRSMIGPDGTYSMSKLPIGHAKISVITGSSTAGPPASVMRQGKGGGGKIAEEALTKRMSAEAKKALEESKKRPADPSGYSGTVPQKYTNPDESGLTIEVTGGKQTHDVKIE